MAISGHNSPQTVINSTANTQTHSGNVTVSSSSEYVVVVVSAWDANALEDPSNWVVTLGGGSALTATQTTVSAGIDFAAATYEIASPPTGTPALAVNLGGAGRGCIAVAWVVSGHDSGAPVSGRGTNTGYASDVTTLGFTRTTTRDNNVLLSAIGMREGNLSSEISLSGGTLSTAVQTGTGTASDISGAWGYHVVPTAGSTTDTYNWTSGARAHLHWVEINVATGGTSVALDTLGYSATVNDLTVQVNTPVAFDTLAYSVALSDLTAAVNTPIALDALAYSASLPDVTVAVPAVVALDSLSYTLASPDVTVSTGIPVALDNLSYSVASPDVSLAVDTPVALDSLAYAVSLPDLTVSASITVGLDALEYTASLPDVMVSAGDLAARPGGWLPVKYIDRDGNEVDLDAVEEAVEEIAEAAPPKRKADLKRVSSRVFAALIRQEAPRRDDVRLLRRALAEREAALEVLNAAILAQQLIDDEITVLLLAA